MMRKKTVAMRVTGVSSSREDGWRSYLSCIVPLASLVLGRKKSV